MPRSSATRSTLGLSAAAARIATGTGCVAHRHVRVKRVALKDKGNVAILPARAERRFPRRSDVAVIRILEPASMRNRSSFRSPTDRAIPETRRRQRRGRDDRRPAGPGRETFRTSSYSTRRHSLEASRASDRPRYHHRRGQKNAHHRNRIDHSHRGDQDRTAPRVVAALGAQVS